MLNEDGLTLLGAQHGHGDVTVLEVRAGLTGAGCNMLGTVERICVHGHKCGEAVSAVDIENLAYGAESVGRIKVSPMLLVELKAPVVPVTAPIGIKVVVIGTFCMDDVSENTLLCHGKGCELKEVIAAVFQNHAMLAGAL